MKDYESKGYIESENAGKGKTIDIKNFLKTINSRFELKEPVETSTSDKEVNKVFREFKLSDYYIINEYNMGPEIIKDLLKNEED